MKKLLCCLLVALFVFLLFACSSPADEIDPQYYALGKEVVGLSDAYLAHEITLSDAQERADALITRLEALPLLPMSDPLYDKSDRVKLYASHLSYSFSLATRQDFIDALHNDLDRDLPILKKLLGLEN